jgi:hypothetical protein
MSNSEKLKLPSESFGLSLGADYAVPFAMPKGEFHLQLVDDLTGNVLEEWVKPNTLTKDAARFAAWLFSSGLNPSGKNPLSGLNGLAVGTGTATVTKTELTKLANEVARVQVTEISFRDETGASSPVVTNVIDFKFTLGKLIADNKALCEMGLVYVNKSFAATNYFGNSSGYTPQYLPQDAASRASKDIRDHDILINYLDFGTITKPPNSTLNITWRLTF